MFHELYLILDALLIAPYRVLSPAVAGFYLGTFCLTLYCLVLGEISLAAVYVWNREHYANQTREMVRMHNLSIQAIKNKDKESFKATNKVANDYFGKSFFARAALFSVSIWPVPFALGWLDIRFTGIDIHQVPFLGNNLRYPFIFIALYIIVRFTFSKIRPKVPFLGKVARMMQQDGIGNEKCEAGQN